MGTKGITATGGTDTIEGDLALIRMAMNGRWNVPDIAKDRILEMPTEVAMMGRDRLVDQDGNEVTRQASIRERLAAVKVLMIAGKLNQELILKAIDKRFPDKVEISDGTEDTVLDLSLEMRKDPEYIRFARAQASGRVVTQTPKKRKRRASRNGHHGNGNGNGNGNGRAK